MNSQRVDRRSFIAAAAATPVAASLTRAATSNENASDRIQVAVIGLGSRGYNLIDSLTTHSGLARIVAVCDVDREHFRDRPPGKGPAFGLGPGKKKVDQAYARLTDTKASEGVAAYSDYRDVLSRNDVDAVIVATPDHWHARCTLDALKAGKDVYCEKPVTHLFQEGQLVYQEVAKQKAVFQTGSQQRSGWQFQRAAELARGGLLGDITTLEVGLPAGYATPQGDPAIIDVPQHLDYDFWCGPAPVLPYMRARHHRWWRGHRAYGGGVLMDWIGHHNDIAHWAINMQKLGPTRVEATDWTYPETDIYNTPFQYTIRCEYEGGIQSTISSKLDEGLRIVGSEGWVFVNRSSLRASDDRWVEMSFNTGNPKLSVIDHRPQTRGKTGGDPMTNDQMANFLECVKSRAECIAPAEVGHRSVTPGHLGYVSQSLGRPLNWDASRESVIDDEEANVLLNKIEYRSPWNPG